MKKIKRQRLKIYVTCVVDVDVPVGMPVTPGALVQAAEFGSDYRDGRYPLRNELVIEGAERIARSAVGSAVSQHFFAIFGNKHIRRRNAAEAKAHEGGVWVHATGDFPVRYRAEVDGEPWESPF